MELVFSSSILLTFLTFLLFVFPLLNVRRSSKTNNKYSNLPPGPRKLPLIGNLHQLLFWSLPHQRMRDLAKKYGPLMHLQLGEVSTIIVSSPEIAKEVLKTHDVTFSSRPQSVAGRIVFYDCTDVVFSQYGDYWRKVRKYCVLELLSMKRVQSFRSIREEEFSSLVNQIASKPGSVINLTDKVAKASSGVIARAAFGKKSKDQESFVSAANDIINFFEGFNTSDLFPSIKLLHLISGVKSKAERLHRKTDEMLDTIINEHKKLNPTVQSENTDKGDEDLVDVLLQLQEHGDLQFPLTTDNIKAIILDMFIAGTGTSSTSVDWAMSELIKNPRLMKRAQAEVREVVNRKGKVDETAVNEMNFLKLVIKETLRLHPPAPLLLPRECREKCEIKGFNIPVKAKVLINGWAIGRDPEYWSDPESFNPERFLESSLDYKGTDYEYIPFGSGRRICPGIVFGMASMDLLLAMLLYHFDWKLPNGMVHEDLDMTESFGATVSRKDNLLLIPIPYHSSPIA